MPIIDDINVSKKAKIIGTIAGKVTGSAFALGALGIFFYSIPGSTSIGSGITMLAAGFGDIFAKSSIITSLVGTIGLSTGTLGLMFLSAGIAAMMMNCMRLGTKIITKELVKKVQNKQKKSNNIDNDKENTKEENKQIVTESKKINTPTSIKNKENNNENIR